MCSMEGWDVIIGPERSYIEPHFCRIYGDCGGGWNLEEACIAVAEEYESIAKMWREQTHPDLLEYDL